MTTSLRSAFTSIVVAMLGATLTAAVLAWVLPSNTIPRWGAMALAVWVGVTAGARAESKAISWGHAMTRGCVAALAAGTTWWLLVHG